MHKLRIARRLFALACLSFGYLLILNGQVFQFMSAQTEVPKETPLVAYIRYGSLESWQEDGRTITALTGKVELYQAHQTIFADSLIGWGKKESEDDTDKAPKARKNNMIFDEIYAEGNVKIIRGKDQILAEKVYYDFEKGTGIMLNVQIRTTPTDADGNVLSGAVPFIIRAKEIYQINHATLVARNASVTTCPHGKPHYHFWVKKVKFIWDEKGKRVTFIHIVPHVAGVPFFYWPYMKKTIGTDQFIRSVKMEKSTRFGVTTQIKYGININKFEREPTGEIKKDKLGYYRKKRWGDFTIQNTNFRKRGLAWEPELEYQDDTYAGFVKGYYIRDKGRDLDVDYDRQFAPLKQHHRGEGDLFHRQQISQKLRLETEITWISDRNLRQEFMESAFKEGKAPESYVYGRYVSDNIGGTVLERYRVNEFYTQTEYLPSVNAYIINKRFNLTRGLAPIYFSSFTEGANIRIRYDEQLKQGALRSWRIDSLNEFITRLSVKPFNVTPFWSARYTSYEKCIAGDKFLDRFIASSGVRISSQFYKKYGLVDQDVAKVSLTHLVSFDFRYTNNYQVTTAPTSILTFDTTDQTEKFEEFYFELRNRFVKQKQEIMNIGAAIEYYPKSYRDTTSQNLNNYLYPFSWIVLAPDEQAKYERRRFSNINMDATWRPRNIVTLYFDTEYNTYRKATEVFNAVISFNPYPGWGVSLSERYFKETTNDIGTDAIGTNALGINIRCVPIEKWQLGISDQYDFEQDRYTNRVYTIRRDLHELFLEFTIWVDKGKDEVVYNITLTPKGLFKRPVQLRSY